MSLDSIKKDTKPKSVYELGFDKNGSMVEQKTNKDHYGKIVYVDGVEYSHHIKVLESNVYDPLGAYSNRRRYLQASFKKVSAKTFNYYMMYLKTNNSIYLTRAQRGFINND